MKKVSLLLSLLFVTIVSICQDKLSTADWQGDLKFLQQTVHKDYSFLFKKISAADFDKEVDQLYKAIPSMKDHEIVAGICRIVSSFKYGHTSLNWMQLPVKYHIVPVNLYKFSDGLYIEGTDKKYASVVGAKVVKIEGMPVEKAMAAVKPLSPAENDFYFIAYGLDFLIVPEALHAQKVIKELKTNITYTLEKDGKTFDQVFEAVDAFRLPRNYGFSATKNNWVSSRDQSNTPYYLKNLDKIYYYEYIPEQKTVYVRHSQIQDDSTEAIPAFYKKVFDFIKNNDVEKLVIDVRLNGGGNNYKNKPIITGIIETAKINKPGKLFVIIGRRTYSACQNLVNEFSNYTNAIFVGEPTGENINFYGDNRRVELPRSKTPVFLSFAWWQDKPQWENADWTAPHIAVDMSFNDYKTNNDPVLAACFKTGDKDVVLDPFRHLQDLFMQGKLEQVEKEAKEIVADPRYRYYSFENKLNETGYTLMGRNMIKEAMFVFGLNTKLYPSSANVWDSFAEVNWKSGNIDKAVEYYNKAIAMDPKGTTGDNARNKLKQIKAGGGNKTAETHQHDN
ncbi:MAG TPA: hypothetical protein PKC72_15385 [Chitinophagaceae bacterium]|nr:hypothetical protein [Chitinophagaceae bacterium]